MKHLLIGVAAIALASAPAFGQGKGNGGGNGNGKAEQGQSMKANANRGSGNGPSMKAAGKPDKGPSMKSAMNDERGPSMKAAGRPDQGPSMRAAAKDDRGPAMRANGNGNRPAQAAAKADNRGNGNANRADQSLRDRDGRDWDDRYERRGGRVLADGRRIYDERGERAWWGDSDRRGLIDGCPPGLAKKNPPCVPPGLAQQRNDDYPYRYANYRPDWWGLSSLGLGSGNYFYDDGYLLRMNGDRVSGYIPLLGGALSLGNPWPSYYAPQPVPSYYVDYFGLGPQNNYRYADNVIYRVDPQTSAITSIAALLTGDDIRVGQPMPMGYDVYNVPYPYRSQYVDGSDAYYRYSDGYVYQVDPETRLVAAAIELLAS